MEYKNRKYPLFSACGLNCGLCSRYHTVGSSKCPGCAGEGFSDKHPSCGILSCCQRKSSEYCYLCADYPCKKYDGVNLSDSFITHKNQLIDLDKARRVGIESYTAELYKKVRILEELLKNHDDGRRKSFLCLAVNLLNLNDINLIMEQIVNEGDAKAAIKEKSIIAVHAFENIAEQKGISLRLRKKTPK
jgi:hypothetical protein